MTAATLMTPTIALLTDFGLRDAYVGVMHGVIRGIAPAAAVVDLCHGVRPQDVREGAYQLAAAAPYFPAGTVFVAVVDPGVGGARRIVCARSAGAVYLGPDNGVLSWALQRDPPGEVVAVSERRWFLPRVSTTFHGRDIFAPVAARLALGLPLGELGPAVDPAALCRLERPLLAAAARPAAGRHAGLVLHVDHFGNLITSVDAALAPRLVALEVGGASIAGPVARCYDERPEGELLLVSGSSDLVEVSIRGGDAAARLGVAAGAPLTAVLGPQEPLEPSSGRTSP